MPKRHFISLTLATVLASSSAFGQSRPLSEKRSEDFYGRHAALTVGGFAASGIASWAVGLHGPWLDWDTFVFDDPVKSNFSESAAALSDTLLVTNITLPVLVQMSAGFDTSMANATLIYAQAQSLSFFLTSTAKLVVRRPRPYTHSQDPRIREFSAGQGSESNVSFFSGHSSASFTGATAGAILYSARTNEPWARHTLWGLEFMLAAATAQLRVRAGRHYRTDIWAGTAVGIAVGALVPKLHRVDMSRIEGTELAVAGIAGGLTMALGEACDFVYLLSFMPTCGRPRDVRVPVEPRRDVTPARRLHVLPAAYAGGGGVQVIGDL